jgi:ribosomal protein S18 acetylase RimI-like enzyme
MFVSTSITTEVWPLRLARPLWQVAGMTIRIRPYDAADRDGVLGLSIRAWQPVFASLEAALGAALFHLLHPDWRRDQTEAVDAVLEDETMAVWVAEADEGVVGFTALVLHEARGLGEIYMIAVDPPAQQAGTGTLLTRFALERLAAAGMTVAMVETGGDFGHAPARRTYERSGFRALPVVRYFQPLAPSGPVDTSGTLH